MDAAGTAPQDFGGVNLVQAILHRQLPEGDFVHDEGDQSPGINDTVFAILALSPIQEPAAQEAIERAVKVAREASRTQTVAGPRPALRQWRVVSRTGKIHQVKPT